MKLGASEFGLAKVRVEVEALEILFRSEVLEILFRSGGGKMS